MKAYEAIAYTRQEDKNLGVTNRTLQKELGSICDGLSIAGIECCKDVPELDVSRPARHVLKIVVTSRIDTLDTERHLVRCLFMTNLPYRLYSVKKLKT